MYIVRIPWVIRKDLRFKGYASSFSIELFFFFLWNFRLTPHFEGIFITNLSMSDFTSSFYKIRKYKSISTTTTYQKKIYNVYLSFCNKDAGSFALQLYTALSSEARVSVFWDNARLGSGDRQISTSAVNIIGNCRVAVIIFSMKYFNSMWCLQEFEKITECCQRVTDGLTVLPVFFDGAYPCNGRLHKNMFGDPFDYYVDRILMVTETSKEQDIFMSWVAAVSDKAFKYSASRYSLRKSVSG